jgi:hypothetical protein
MLVVRGAACTFVMESGPETPDPCKLNAERLESLGRGAPVPAGRGGVVEEGGEVRMDVAPRGTGAHPQAIHAGGEMLGILVQTDAVPYVPSP